MPGSGFGIAVEGLFFLGFRVLGLRVWGVSEGLNLGMFRGGWALRMAKGLGRVRKAY